MSITFQWISIHVRYSIVPDKLERHTLTKGEDPDEEKPAGADTLSESDESFLSENEIKAIRLHNSSRSRRWWWWIIFAAVHLVVLAVYVGTVMELRDEIKKLRKHGPQMVLSPANEAVEWEEHSFVFNSMKDGPFSGYPRPEIDKNWHDLLNAENIMIEPEYMAAWDREDFGVAIPDGKGYIGTLNVYHELHCLKRIYQYTYPEVYAKNLTPQQAESSRLHKEHCLDFLRQSVMCHADVGVITFQWSPESLVPVANATTHQCANWKKLDDWTKARTVDMMKPGWLVHPSKGVAYPESSGEQNDIQQSP